MAAERGLTRFSYFVYPPWVAIFAVPLTLFTPYQGLVLLYVLNWILVVAGLILLARSLPAFGAAAVAVVFLFLCPSYMFIQGLEAGQTSIAIFFLLVLFASAFSRHRAAEAGLWWALIAGIKVFPVLFALPLLALRRWRLLVAGAIAGAGLLAVSVLVLGPAVHVRYFHLMLQYGPYTTERLTNQSLAAVLLRWIEPLNPGDLTLVVIPPLVAWISRIFTLGLLAVTVLLLHRGRRGSSPWLPPLAFSLMVPWVFTVSPFTWTHHLVVLAVPFTVAAAYLLAQTSNRAGRLVWPWLVAWGGLLSLYLYNRMPTGFWHNPLAPILAALPLAGTWVLYALVATLHVRERAATT